MSKSNIAIYPGSFDPLTLGHSDLIRRMSSHYDKLFILIAENPAKSHLFTVDERISLIKSELKGLENVEVDVFSGLTIEYAKKVGAKTILRGLRAISDFEHEFAMANMNKHLASHIETVLVFTNPGYSFVSSRLVKEVARYGGDLSKLVPEAVEKALQHKFQNKKD